jgi:hypothetical protein
VDAALSFESRASAETLFDLLADAPSWPTWFGSARSVGWMPANPADSALRVRRVRIGPFSVLEAVVEESRPTHHAYQVRTVLPVRGHRADVRFHPDTRGTRIDWTMSFEPLIPGTGRLVRLGLIFGVSKLASALISAAER